MHININELMASSVEQFVTSGIRGLVNIMTDMVNILDCMNIDGQRIILDNNNIVHLRSSANAPELRCYREAESMNQAINLCHQVIRLVSDSSRISVSTLLQTHNS